MDHADRETVTKHENIINYISKLQIGSKISVRSISKNMSVSEGTAYRAIKEAENQGLVSTHDRIGTIRVEKKLRHNIEKLTFAEVVNMVDGEVLGGVLGLHKTLNKFVIGAMERDAMMRYVEPDSLLIIGNREREQYAALEQGAAVLITGGFQTGENVKQLADKLSLPIISSSYDTFTVASLINRAIYDRLIKKKIILVEDIISPETQVYALRGNQTVEHWKQLMETTGYTRFPVVDEWNRVTGIITTKDIVGAKTDQTIDKLMTRGPNTVTFTTSVASAAHTMVWEGIELLPVIDNKGKLVTVISRKDVLKSLQYVQKQPQNGETFEDLIVSALEETKNEQGQFILKCVISPQMTNHLGTVSEGVLTTLITQSAYRTVKEVKKVNLVLENMTTYFLRPVQIDSQIEIHPGIIEVSRKFSKVEVGVYYQGNLVAKAILSAQVMD